MSVVLRIKEYIDFKGITNQKFEQKIGYSNGAFASQVKKNKEIGSGKLENILINYPDINPEWLLTGKGEMLKKEDPQRTQVVQEEAPSYKTKNQKDEKIIELQEKYIEKLEAEIKILQANQLEIKELKAKIEKLKKEEKVLKKENHKIKELHSNIIAAEQEQELNK